MIQHTTAELCNRANAGSHLGTSDASDVAKIPKTELARKPDIYGFRAMSRYATYVYIDHSTAPLLVLPPEVGAEKPLTAGQKVGSAARLSAHAHNCQAGRA